MRVVLYWMSISHPSQVARKMLELKGVEYELVDVVPLNQRIHLRLAGFSRGTVPALKLDGKRIQGSRRIARALDERWPEPPLFPPDPVPRARVEEAERWGEEQLQPIPRRLFRYGVARNPELRQWVVRAQRLPVPALTAQAIRPAMEWYLRTIEADGRRASEAGVRADLAALPALLDHVDRLIGDGTLTLDPPNAATLQIMASVNLLGRFADLAELVASHASAEPARELFRRYRAGFPPFLDPEWLAPVRIAPTPRVGASESERSSILGSPDKPGDPDAETQRARRLQHSSRCNQR
ncbi:MAG: glutathione S-transferase N-terminal domain-containing protein [Solirubrobacterales bacterium]|nr:glutathione S-transferase N-terminal domain-containing protein [Solirubrobacterales bacterium]